MKRVDFLVVVIMVVLGLFLYAGACRILGYPLLSHSEKIDYLRPVVTGHEGELLPSIDLVLADSILHIDLASVPSGSPIVLFYFITDCPYCQAETREIINNISSMRHIQFYLLTPYPYIYMKSFSNDYKLEKYSNIKVGSELNFKFGSYFSTQYVPFIAIYDKKKRLKAAFNGNLKFEQIISECLE